MPATYEPIASTTLNADASGITFSSIPQTYTDLKLIIVALSGTDASVYLRFNNDTTFGNYSTIIMKGNSGTASGASINSNSQAFAVGYSVGLSQQPAYCDIDILNYRSSTFKTIIAQGYMNQNGPTINELCLSANHWQVTNAIDTILVRGGTFQANTTVTLYGITAA